MKPAGEEMTPWRRTLGIFLTFNFVCLCWVFFRAESMDKAWFMLQRVFTDFQWEVIPQFIAGYKWVFLMILFGYGLHAIPDALQQRTINMTIKSPMLYKVAITVAVIWVIMQLKSSEIQPFIYFQF